MTVQDPDDPTLLNPPVGTGRSSGRGSFGGPPVGSSRGGGVDDPTALEPPPQPQLANTAVVRSTPTTELAGGDLDAKPGSFIGGYEVVRTLGRGGMGIVYLARDPRLGRTVALKVLPMTAGTQEAAVARFGREAKAIAALDHPAIRPIYGHGRDDQARVFWLAMGFVDGRPYDDVVKEVGLGHESSRRAARVVADAARAIAFAHKKGVIHRDLKPSNIMVEKTSAATGTPGLEEHALKVHVLDFGLARLDGSSELTVEGQVMGTLRFMPPEQALGAEASALSDVYSLGATLFWALTGEGPYDVQRIENLQLRLARGDAARRPTSLRPDVPRDLEAIIIKSLELEPVARYAGADALADDLERYLEGEAVLASPPSPWRELRRTVRRQRLLLVPAALVLVAAGILGANVALRRVWATNDLKQLRTRWDEQSSLEDLLAARAAYLDANLDRVSPEAAADAVEALRHIDADLLRARLSEARATLDAAVTAWAGRPSSPGQPAVGREPLAPESVRVAATAARRGAAAILAAEREGGPKKPPVHLLSEAGALEGLAAATLALASGETIERNATDATTLVTVESERESERALAGGGPERLPAWGVIRSAAPNQVASARLFDPLDVLQGFPAPPRLADRGGLWKGMVLVAAPGRAFLIDTDEVTVGEFTRFVRDAQGFRREPHEPSRLVTLMERCEREDASRPMTGVTVDEARAYARFNHRRLPTAAEWRTAAGLVPWRAPVRPADGRGPDAPPRKRSESPWDVSPCGANNMAGNVAEWVEPDPAAASDKTPHALGGSSRDIGLSLDVWPLRGAKQSDAVGFRCAADVPAGGGR